MTSREAAREMTEIDPYRPEMRLAPESCTTEQVGNDVVAFETERMRYHTMHELVFQVLGASDGTRSVEEIAALVFVRGEESRLDLTGQALLELMDADLIIEDTAAKASLLSRRTVGKAAAALFLGGMGLPLIKSITAPESAAAQSCVGDWDSGHGCAAGQGSCCANGCCCTSGPTSTSGFCAYDVDACNASDDYECR